jgi:osmotically inducible protein OsmC
MPDRKASAVWNGGLKSGDGRVKGVSGAVDVAYSFATRFEESPGTNPEELIAAAHAACYSMALAAGLEKAGHKPQKIETTAKVSLGKTDTGFAISGIHLETRGTVEGVDQAAFQKFAEDTKTGCPVSRALASVPMTLDAKLA